MRYDLATAICVLLVTLACREPSPPAAGSGGGQSCARVGDARPLPCGDGQVKLVALNFYRSIGSDAPVVAAGDEVFVVAELEWPGAAADTPHTALPLPVLQDGAGGQLPRDEPALAAFHKVQDARRYTRRGADFDPRRREAVIFVATTTAAMSGLRLVFASSCPDQGPEIFCLGRHLIR